MTTPAEIARSLTDAQQSQILSLTPGERRMGGYGRDSGCPGLIESWGIHHPIFGAHYQLTPLGLQVRQILQEQNNAQG